MKFLGRVDIKMATALEAEHQSMLNQIHIMQWLVLQLTRSMVLPEWELRIFINAHSQGGLVLLAHAA